MYSYLNLVAKKQLKVVKRKIFPDIRFLTEKAIENFYKGNKAKAERALEKIFNKNLKNLPQKYKLYLKNFLIKLARQDINDSQHKKSQKELIKKTNDLNTNLLNLKEWLDLQYLSIRFGLFQASKAFRQKAIEKVYNDFKSKNNNLPVIINAFNASIDRSEFEIASHLLEIAKNTHNSTTYERMLFYFSLFKNGFEKIISPAQDFDKVCQKYLRYISGKSIAIVGPAPTDEENGTEIDSYDIVIRNGYKGKKYQPAVKKFGLRTDVSYYGNGNARYYVVNRNSEFLRDLDWAVFKSKEYAKHVSEIDKNRCRCFKKNHFYFCGSPTMIQNIVFDILHFNPKKIKLFNLNFNLAGITHYKTYHPEKNKPEKPVYSKLWINQHGSTGGFAHHDLLSQIIFTRNLWKTGRIEVDNECERVLRMSNDEFLKEMERIHIIPSIKG